MKWGQQEQATFSKHLAIKYILVMVTWGEKKKEGLMELEFGL